MSDVDDDDEQETVRLKITNNNNNGIIKEKNVEIDSNNVKDNNVFFFSPFS